MELLLSFTSPYSRKARVVARERGIALKETALNAFDDPNALLAHSAIGKVPVLVTDDGPVHDSRVICELLDTLGDAPPLLPVEALWADRTRAAIGDGVMDAALQVVLDGRRAEDEQVPSNVARQTARMMRTIVSLTPGEVGRLTLGDVAVACALHYLDFRLPDLDWRRSNAPLADWHAAVEERSAFEATRLGQPSA